jgi:hypothetical protein
LGLYLAKIRWMKRFPKLPVPPVINITLLLNMSVTNLAALDIPGPRVKQA